MNKIGFILAIFAFWSHENVCYGSYISKPNISKEDLDIAKKIEKVFENLKNNELPKDISLDLKKIQNSLVFKEYLTFLTELQQISKNSKNPTLLSENCKAMASNIKYPKNSERLLYSLESNLEKSCFSSLANSIIHHEKDSTVKEKLFDQNVDLFLKNNTEEFTNYYSNLPTEDIAYITISKKIINYMVTNDSLPDKKILAHLPHTFESSLFIQKHIEVITNGNAYFNEELKNIFGNYNKNLYDENYKDAIENITFANSFFHANSKYIDHEQAWSYFAAAAKRLTSLKFFEMAEKIFDFCISVAPPHLKDESYFNKVWIKIVQKKYQEASDLSIKLGLTLKIDKLESKLQFWVGYALYQNGRKEESSKIFKILQQTNPLSFYSIVSSNYIEGDHLSLPLAREIVNSKGDSFESEQALWSKLNRIRIWGNIGNDKFIQMEANDLLEDGPFSDKNTPIYHDIAKVLNSLNKHYITFRLLHRILDDDHSKLDLQTIQYLFPFVYFDKIKSLSEDLDPYLVLSLIRQESAFNVYAKSSVGATGLMQLMPSTARRFMKNVTISELHRPDTNLKIGIKYLKSLFARYDSNPILVFASYNAGEGNINKWIKEILVHDDPLVNIESIPFKETRQYVKLIYRNIFFYKMLDKTFDRSKDLAFLFNTTKR